MAPAQVAPSAGDRRIDQDPDARGEDRAFRRRHHLADHLVTDDDGVLRRYPAGEDLDVGAADPERRGRTVTVPVSSGGGTSARLTCIGLVSSAAQLFSPLQARL